MWPSQKALSERHRWAGREGGGESDREGEGKLSVPPALPRCLLNCVGSAVLWWREITKAQPEVACMDTVITSAPPTYGMNTGRRLPDPPASQGVRALTEQERRSHCSFTVWPRIIYGTTAVTGGHRFGGVVCE